MVDITSGVDIGSGITIGGQATPSISIVQAWSSIANGANTWVAIGSAQSNYKSAYSTDGGVSWTQSTLPIEEGADIVYATSKFVVAGFGTDGAYSTTGASWTSTTMPSSQDWGGIAYGAGTFVAVSPGINYATSTDGITWTARTFSVSGSRYGIVYGNSEFVSLGIGTGTAYSEKSTDGINWTGTSTGLTGFATVGMKITYGNGYYVAMNQTDKIAYSTDGLTWTQSTIGLTNDTLIGVGYGNGRFVVCGGNNTSSPAVINYAYYANTPSGTWTQSTLPATGLWVPVGYGNYASGANWVMLGTDGNSIPTTSYAIISTDGATWI